MEYGTDSGLVVVDVQNDFADPSGGLYVAGGEQIVPLVNDEIARATAGAATVVCTQDWHPPVTPHFAKDGGTWPVHCVMGTWGAELHPDLKVDDDVARIRTGSNGEDGYSGFTMRDPITGATSSTGLALLLRDRGVRRIAVVGLATDYCVRATALDAVSEGFDTTVLRDQVRSVEMEPGDGERALAEMAAAGVHLE